jgi:hypothetical protein
MSSAILGLELFRRQRDFGLANLAFVSGNDDLLYRDGTRVHDRDVVVFVASGKRESAEHNENSGGTALRSDDPTLLTSRATCAMA